MHAALWLCIFVGHASAAYGTVEERDSVTELLPEVEVVQTGRAPVRRNDGGKIMVSGNSVAKLSRTFGEADFLTFLRQLPNAESTGDYASGVSVNGGSPSHVQYLIDGAPVIFPYRFGGIFSTFNGAHFREMDFSMVAGADMLPRLGAAIDISPRLRFSNGAEGSVNVGMTASSLSICGGLGDRVSLSLSGRISYIDHLYGKWLSESGGHIRYGFEDLNATAACRITGKDELKADFFRSSDRLAYDDEDYALDTRLRWSNELYSLRYAHTSDAEVSLQIYHSRFKDRLSLGMSRLHIEAPASISSTGLCARIGRSAGVTGIESWEGGVRVCFDEGMPQWAILETEGVADAAVRKSSAFPQKMLTAVAFGKAGVRLLSGRLRLIVESGIGIFRSSTKGRLPYTSAVLTPGISLVCPIPEGSVTFGGSLRCQPLHCVGFSELGLASDFWIGATEEAPAERALMISCSATRRLFLRGLAVSAAAYWTKVSDQAEYQGQVVEIIDTDYSPFSRLIISDGFNYGVSVALSKPFGVVTGELSVSYDDGLRHAPSRPSERWKSLYASGFVGKASVQWHAGRRWTLSATFRIASGRRYTPVDALYIVGNNIAMEYGVRNFGRLPAYQRLDIGATYEYATGGWCPLRHLVNFSLINAYGHRNVEMQYFMLNSGKGDYALKRLYSLYRFLPSVSYTIQF